MALKGGTTANAVALFEETSRASTRPPDMALLHIACERLATDNPNPTHPPERLSMAKLEGAIPLLAGPAPAKQAAAQRGRLGPALPMGSPFWSRTASVVLVRFASRLTARC